MALKRRTKVNEAFSMASMTDVIFLLLIFFMVTSTVVIPNAIKVTLPQAKKQTPLLSACAVKQKRLSSGCKLHPVSTSWCERQYRTF